LIRDEVSRLSSVENVTLTSGNPLLIWNETTDLEYSGKGTDEIRNYAFFAADFDFVKTMGLKISEGRDYDKELSTDSVNFLINETAAKILGSAGKPGSRITFAKKEGTIIGVINDFHMTHMNFPIKPLIILCNQDQLTTLLVKFRPGMADSGKLKVGGIAGKFIGGTGTDSIDMHDAFENIYRENIFRVGKLSMIFAFLSLWIACLGLISLSMFNAEIRTKEVGIHMVHGAGIFQVIKMLSVEYARYVAFSFLFAIPAGFLLMNKLFSRTAYHTNISAAIFVVAALFVLVIALSTVSWQAYRIAVCNPAETLKYE
jgi:hypothetical protein